jgi:hypothetical protein
MHSIKIHSGGNTNDTAILRKNVFLCIISVSHFLVIFYAEFKYVLAHTKEWNIM